MSRSPIRQPGRLTPDLIANAAVDPPFNRDDGEGSPDAAVINILSEQLDEARYALSELESENDRLLGQRDFETAKAELLKPYANRVYWFVATYCGVVAAMLVAAGLRSITGFDLSDVILSIIAGSTAISVIGLIGLVVSGLFGARSRR